MSSLGLAQNMAELMPRRGLLEAIDIDVVSANNMCSLHTIPMLANTGRSGL